MAGMPHSEFSGGGANGERGGQHRPRGQGIKTVSFIGQPTVEAEGKTPPGVGRTHQSDDAFQARTVKKDSDDTTPSPWDL